MCARPLLYAARVFRTDLRRALEYEHAGAGIGTQLAYVVFRPGVQAVGCYRLARRLTRIGLRPLGQALSMIGFYLTGAELPPRLDAGPGLVVYHPAGVVIHADARIGRNLRIHTGAVIGVRVGDGRQGAPIIGDDVLIGAGAKILGPVTIGDRARIGANAVVIADVPADAHAVGVPARIVQPRTTA
jgi:serine O-acetyltransferase